MMGVFLYKNLGKRKFFKLLDIDVSMYYYKNKDV